MSDENPYSPPRADGDKWGSGGINDEPSVDVVTARVPFDVDLMREGFVRLRSLSKGYRVWRWLRLVVAAMVIVAGLSMVFVSVSFNAGLALVFGGYLLCAEKLQDHWSAQHFRKSPHHGTVQVFHLSEQGVEIDSELESAQLTWGTFLKAVIFEDGVMLFRGPKLIHWIADKSIETVGGASRMRQLVAEKLPTETG